MINQQRIETRKDEVYKKICLKICERGCAFVNSIQKTGGLIEETQVRLIA
jgi:hypothetical protein